MAPFCITRSLMMGVCSQSVRGAHFLYGLLFDDGDKICDFLTAQYCEFA